MQLCALDDDDVLVFAVKAAKQKDYQCLECRETVRLRSGLQRRPHFYHAQPNTKCRLHAKGMPHLMVQYYLMHLLSQHDAEMECRFPAIGRIADVVWHSKKIVFEIQYSPISPDEVKLRNEAYASVGYRVVWILHDVRYNRSVLSAAEDYLIDHPHYFTNMDDEGVGHIYDQFSCVERCYRVFRLPKLSVDLSLPYQMDDQDHHPRVPRKVLERFKTWKMVFSGDTLDRLNHNHLESELVRRVAALHEGPRFNIEKLKAAFKYWIARPYKILLHHFLERACR